MNNVFLDVHYSKKLEENIKKELGIDRRNKNSDIVMIKNDIKINYIGICYLYCLVSKHTDMIYVGGIVGDIKDILRYVILTHDIYECSGMEYNTTYDISKYNDCKLVILNKKKCKSKSEVDNMINRVIIVNKYRCVNKKYLGGGRIEKSLDIMLNENIESRLRKEYKISKLYDMLVNLESYKKKKDCIIHEDILMLKEEAKKKMSEKIEEIRVKRGKEIIDMPLIEIKDYPFEYNIWS
jgi:hypothetical protein